MRTRRYRGRRAAILATALLAATLLAAGTGQGRAQGAAEPTQEQLQAERDRLFQEILKDPSNLDLLYAYAQVAIALQDYDAAIASYERMLIFNPDLPRIHLELGVLYFRAGSNGVARYHLELARSAANAPPEVKAKVDEYLAQIDEAGNTHDFDGSIFAGLRYQTNANAGPPDGTRVQVGNLPGLSELDEGTAEDDFNAVVSGTLNHSWDFGNQTYDSWDTNFFYYGALHFEQDELNLGTTELKTGPQFNEVLTRGLSLRPYASATWIGLDDGTYYWSFGGGLQAEYDLSARTTLSLDGQYRRRLYDEQYDDREGSQYLGQASLRWILGARDLVTLSGALVRTTAEGEWRASWEGGGSIAYTHLFNETRELLGAPLATTVYAGGRYTGYDGPDPLIEPGTTRADRELRAGGSLVLSLAEDLSLVGTLEYRDVESNIDFYSYDNLAVTVGMLYRF